MVSEFRDVDRPQTEEHLSAAALANRPIELLEQALGTTALKNFLPMQPGDVPATYTDVDGLAHAVGFAPATPIEEGVVRFVDRYRGF